MPYLGADRVYLCANSLTCIELLSSSKPLHSKAFPSFGSLETLDSRQLAGAKEEEQNSKWERNVIGVLSCLAFSLDLWTGGFQEQPNPCAWHTVGATRSNIGISGNRPSNFKMLRWPEWPEAEPKAWIWGVQKILDKSTVLIFEMRTDSRNTSVKSLLVAITLILS